MNNIRNVGIIAHVDHGKTTLVDALLRQSKTKITKETDDKDLIMDSNELERKEQKLILLILQDMLILVEKLNAC